MFFSPPSAGSTPKIIKGFLYSILGFSVGFSLLTILLKGILFFNPSLLFSLSLYGIQQSLYFQFFTYPFIQLPSFEFNLDYLIFLFLSVYVLWITSTQITEKIGIKKFTIFLAVSILSTGGFSFLLMSFAPLPYLLSGTTPLCYALLISWLTLYPNTQVSFFFTSPLQIKHLIFIILGIKLLLNLMNENFVEFGTCLFSASFAYLFFTAISHPFSLQKKGVHHSPRSSKIYDFNTGDPIAEEELFIDKMLEKISKNGKSSLSSKEKKKMDEISKNSKS